MLNFEQAITPFFMYRYLSILLLFFGLTQVNAQDLDTRQLNIMSIEAAQEATFSYLEPEFSYSGSYPLSPLNFDKEADNFWEPVDMARAVSESNNRPTRSYNVKALQAKTFGFSTNNNFTARGPSTTENIVYKDMSQLNLLGSCPPIGRCWRCAPFRSSRFNR